MNIKNIAAAMVLSVAGTSAMASLGCDRMTDWESLGPPGLAAFGQTFTSATNGTYHDCYTFELGSNANSFGGVIEIDPILNKLDIDVTLVSLFLGDSTTAIRTDDSPLTFSFSGLAGPAGTYTLMIDSVVTRDPGLFKTPVAYLGAIVTVAAAVPEPGAIALLLAGLAGVGIATSRRRRS